MTSAYSDSVLGALTPSADGDWWETSVTLTSRRVAFKIGGHLKPNPELLEHARQIVTEYSAFNLAVRTFLSAEAAKQPHLAAEIETLEVEDICLFWPTRPDDGMLYFKGGHDDRVWRCDYLNRRPVHLGFDV